MLQGSHSNKASMTLLNGMLRINRPQSLDFDSCRRSVYELIERRFEEDDLQSLLELLESSFDGWHDARYWAWKYQRNPHGSPIIWVAEDRGRIVGCYILNPVRMSVGRVSAMGAQSVDAAVDSAYRGAGIFKKLAVGAITTAAEKGVALVFAFPTEIAYRGQVRIGYYPVFVIPKMFKVLRIGSFLEDQSSSNIFLKKVLAIMRPLQRGRGANIRPKPNDGLMVSETRNFDSRFSAFWRKVNEKNSNILIEREPAYLKWRYTDHPEKQYTTYVCERHDEIVGYVVLSVERNMSLVRGRAGSLSVGDIVDLLTVPSQTNVASMLVSASCDYFEREEVDIARCWMAGWHPFRKILRKFGFSEHYELLRRAVLRPKYNEQLICYVTSKATIQEAFRLKQDKSKLYWFIMQGDADYT